MKNLWRRMCALWCRTRSELAAGDIVDRASRLNDDDLLRVANYFTALINTRMIAGRLCENERRAFVGQKQ